MILYAISFSSCNKSIIHASLLQSGDYLSYQVEDDIKLPQLSVYTFIDNDVEYLSFQNSDFNRRNEILFYEVRSGELVKKISMEKEGNNAIPGAFMGYCINGFDNIIIPSAYTNTLYVTDSSAVIKQKLFFDNLPEESSLIPVIINSSLQLVTLGDTLYLPQLPNPFWQEEMMDKSRTCFLFDTVSGYRSLLPMKFPPLITYKDVGTSAGFGANYSNAFDGTYFLYSFFSSDKIYRTLPSHTNIEEIEVKSRYIDKAEVLRLKTTNANDVVRAMYEHPSYGNIVYDKYRDVFYLFAFPKTQTDPDDDPFELCRAVFTILILDKNLTILGETLFPEYTYNPNLYFVLEDGLYLSTNHIKNPEYSDDILTFERINLHYYE